MSLVAKILLGTAAAVAATVVVVEVVSKLQEKTHKDDSSYKTIKEKAQEKAIEITTNGLLFASNHMDTINTVSSVVACALPILELFLDIRQFRTQDRLEKKMNRITEKLDEIGYQTEWCYKNVPECQEEKEKNQAFIDMMNQIGNDYKKDIKWRTF